MLFYYISLKGGGNLIELQSFMQNLVLNHVESFCIIAGTVQLNIFYFVSKLFLHNVLLLFSLSNTKGKDFFAILKKAFSLYIGRQHSHVTLMMAFVILSFN